jgi:hypothetical protein
VETLEHSAFSPRYNCEDLSHIHSSFGVIRKIYILMKCFCDIPLSPLMEKHMEAYGSYGIGLRKEWGIRNNLTPVHYIPVLSRGVWYQSNLSSLYSSAFSKTSDAYMRDLITNYFIYTKPYEKNGTVFYNEREWRYVPSLDNIRKVTSEDLRIKHHFIFPNQATTNLDSQSLNADSNNLKNNEYVRLSFDLNDIKYLIVERHEETDQIRQLINGNSNIEILIADDILKCKETLET